MGKIPPFKNEDDIDDLVVQEADNEDAWEFEAEVLQPKTSVKKLPKFKNEQEEGRWYAAHKEDILEDAEAFPQEDLDRKSVV